MWAGNLRAEFCCIVKEGLVLEMKSQKHIWHRHGPIVIIAVLVMAWRRFSDVSDTINSQALNISP